MYTFTKHSYWSHLPFINSNISSGRVFYITSVDSIIDHRTKMAWNDGCAEGQLDLPLIDLSLLLPSDLQDLHKPCMSSPLLEMTTKIRDACQQWGFFRVINHGVESEAIQRMDSAARDLFALPTEVKDRLLPFSNYVDGYTGRSAAVPYRETVMFSRPLHSDSTQRISGHLWPQGNAEFWYVLFF